MESPALAAIVAQALGADVQPLSVERRPLRGGLESPAVTLVTVRGRDPRGRGTLVRVVEKRLAGAAVREAAVYAAVARSAPGLAPRLLGSERTAEGIVLYLEAIARASAWPWRDPAAVAEVLAAVAPLHALPPGGVGLPPWDYDAELGASAAETLAVLERTPLRELRAFAPRVRRAAGHVSAMRRQLEAGPLPPAALHGDLHSGNAFLRRGGAPARVALVDWGRARVGSPLEDVSSWLQSLAYWEPGVRRRHDTLLCAYLAARGLPVVVTRAVREGYWLAAATNALAGALRYHLEVAASPHRTELARALAGRAARDWLRVIRRALEVWTAAPATRGGGRDRRTAPPPPSPAPSPAP